MTELFLLVESLTDKKYPGEKSTGMLTFIMFAPSLPKR